MNAEEYRIRGKEMVDYIADYLENIRDRKIYPDQEPGFLKEQIPDSAPVEGEEWPSIFGDIEKIIMPGMAHWQSPHMHAYFPALTSYPSILGDTLASGINCIGFTWAASPVCTELETIVMNWLGKMIGLPDDFLFINKCSKGGGVIQTTASEATFTCLLAGRARLFEKYKKILGEDLDKAELNVKLVAYCSTQAHSSVEKAGLIGLVKMRFIEVDENLSMRGDKLMEQIKKDKEMGLIPFWVCATLGTTGACAFDNLDEVGSVCVAEDLWLHVDAAYAGSAFICPEFRIWLKGISKAHSMAFNPSKWLMVNFDCTAMWVKDALSLHQAFLVNPLYLQHPHSGAAVDYMHWTVSLSRKFRALKMWFVIRNYGITGLQKHIREGVRLAQKFEALVLADPRFEIPATRHLGLVTFRLKGINQLTEQLLMRLNARGKLHCVPACLVKTYVIRFTVTSQKTTVDDILRDWKEIRTVATELLAENELDAVQRPRIQLKDTKETSFGSSLLLSNSPNSPKIINGSFAGVLNHSDILASFAILKTQAQNSPHMRRRIKGILMSGKQFSLDSRLDLFHGIETDFEAKSTSTQSTAHPPLLEDSNEYDEGNEVEDEERISGDLLVVPQKHNRSKSVDHQVPLVIEKEPCMKCTRCGHELKKY